MYKHFCSYLSNTSQSTISVSKARVLSFLGNEFGCLVSSVCSHTKIGTMFYRTKSDPYALLSHALSEQSASTADSTNVTTCADEYSNYINGEVHKLARYLLTEAYKDETLTKAVDVDKFLDHICSVTPHLWEYICSLTRTVNEQKGRKAAVSADSFSGRIKRVRRAYLLSVILFATNPECSYPFHIPLADAVESCGGSSELITILNRIGATASLPTLNRHILSVSEERQKEGVSSVLIDKSFTVASADNIDFLHSHAAVYSGSQHRSYHATSVQVLQPRPHS